MTHNTSCTHTKITALASKVNPFVGCSHSLSSADQAGLCSVPRHLWREQQGQDSPGTPTLNSQSLPRHSPGNSSSYLSFSNIISVALLLAKEDPRALRLGVGKSGYTETEIGLAVSSTVSRVQGLMLHITNSVHHCCYGIGMK